MSVRLTDVTEALERIAPLKLAAEWDNVGLLVEPTSPPAIERILLTIDLTMAVLEEAVERGAGMIVAYHPPIFQPLRRLVGGSVAVRLLERGIAVYSPHTALDAAPGGVNDWLAEGIGEGEAEPIEPAGAGGERCRVLVYVEAGHADRLRDALAAAGAGCVGGYDRCSFTSAGVLTYRDGRGGGRVEAGERVRLEMSCGVGELPAVRRAIELHHPESEPMWEVYQQVEAPEPDAGQGRLLRLGEPAGLDVLTDRIKGHLGLERVRVAAAAAHREGEPVRSVAMCPGAGGSVLKGAPAELLLTGEMRHHDILAANARGASVILTDHTNTERGYLPVLRDRLRSSLPEEVGIDISEVDADPLKIV